MKKIISVLSALCIILGSLTNVFASEKTEEVLLAVKNRIPDTSSYIDFRSFENEYKGTTTYSFIWENHEENKEMNLSANKDGVIISYNINNYAKNSTGITLDRASTDYAYEKATELCNILNPMLSDTYKLEKNNQPEHLNSNYFTFNLQRYKNGIPVIDDTGRVRINLDCTEIISYYINYTEDYTFENPNNIVDTDSAKKAYRDKIGFYPKYNTIYDYDNKKIDTSIIYQQRNYDNKFISATTGEVISPNPASDETFREETENSKDMIAGGSSSESLSNAEISQLEQLGTLKSKEEILKIISDSKYINFSDEYRLENYRTSSDSISQKYYAHLNFSTDENYYAFSIKVDMQTGDILSFYKTTAEKSASSDAYKLKAEEVSKYYSGNKFKEYKLSSIKNNIYTYERYVNDIVCPFDTIRVGINEYGDVFEYNISYTDTNFISPDGIMTMDEALTKLYSYSEYKPYYIKDKNKTYSLVYSFNESFTQFDAKTGEKTDVFDDYKIEYTDISGHWAEKQIKSLARYGIGFCEEKFNPDSKLTQKEFVTLLNCIWGNYTPVSAKANFELSYNILKSNNIIDESEISPDEETTREASAILLIRCMDAEKFAKIEEIYSCPFTDVKENKGYISLLYGLGIISGNPNGTFCPKNTITRAEAIVIIYNFLNNVGI